MSGTETVTVFYGLDKDDTTWYTLGTLTSNGRFELAINGVQGKARDYIRFRFDLTRGSTSTKTPIIEFWANEWLRLLPVTPGYTFLVDLSKPYKGRTPLQMFNLLQSYADSDVTTALLPFTFTDALTNDTATYYVNVSRMGAQIIPGRENRGEGQAEVSVIVPKYKERVLGG
jgi:hypothetical protein